MSLETMKLAAQPADGSRPALEGEHVGELDGVTYRFCTDGRRIHGVRADKTKHTTVGQGLKKASVSYAERVAVSGFPDAGALAEMCALPVHTDEFGEKSSPYFAFAGRVFSALLLRDAITHVGTEATAWVHRRIDEDDRTTMALMLFGGDKLAVLMPCRTAGMNPADIVAERRVFLLTNASPTFRFDENGAVLKNGSVINPVELLNEAESKMDALIRELEELEAGELNDAECEASIHKNEYKSNMARAVASGLRIAIDAARKAVK